MSLDHDKIVAMVEQMPTFPASAHRIIELTNDVNCAPRDLVDVIEHDPVLTLKVLKLINSSYFSLAQEVTSVKHAVVYLGINTIKNLALSVATIGALPSENEAGFDMGAFWMHSLLTAAIARDIATTRTNDEIILSNSFVGGLLHDIGKVVLVQFLAEEFGRSLRESEETGRELFEVETEIIGINHAHLGALVAERWQLPEALVSSIRVHHDALAIPPESALENALVVGNVLSKKAAAAANDTQTEYAHPQLPDQVATWLGTSLDEAYASLTKLSDEVEKAKMFVELGSS